MQVPEPVLANITAKLSLHSIQDGNEYIFLLVARLAETGAEMDKLLGLESLKVGSESLNEHISHIVLALSIRVDAVEVQEHLSVVLECVVHDVVGLLLGKGFKRQSRNHFILLLEHVLLAGQVLGHLDHFPGDVHGAHCVENCVDHSFQIVLDLHQVSIEA